MCGIVGFIDHRLGIGHSEAAIEGMASRLQHRGPDDHGRWTDPAAGVALGHRRLSIVDLSPQGHQPMTSACGRYVIVFNGEIYNHRDVRARLETEYGMEGWRGHSDTEVLLAALTHRGLRGALDWVVGMYAFAVWDRQERSLSLVRDRMGEKPLYFGRAGDVFLFASELKAFAAHPAWRPEIDRDALALLMRYGYVPVPYSIYRNVSKLPPGSLLTVRSHETGADRGAQPVPYWSVIDAYRQGTADPFHGSPEDAVGALDALLTQSVGLQMVADVPLGAFLSGGIDSSTIVALMQAQSTSRVRTFSIGFHDPAFDEARHAAAVARYLGTAHTEVYVTPRQALDVIPRLPTLFDEPFADASQIPSFLIAEVARRDVTVALSGDGGDELFYGYRRFVDARRMSRVTRRLPRGARVLGAAGLRGAARAVGSAGRRSRRLRRTCDRLHKAALVLGASNERELYWDVLSHWGRAEQVVRNAGAQAPPPIGTAADPADLDDWMMYQDMVAFLPDDVLVKVDRTSMGVSLEARAPLLDHRVVEFAWRIPFAWKYRDGCGKWLLRQVLYRHVPRALVDRPKMGFDVPIADWLRGELRDWAEALLDAPKLREQGFFDVESVRRKWDDHVAGRRNWQYCLWDVLMFQAWLAQNHPAGVVGP
jgi:asparagine synthase (glutamine-hydrolysing)